MKHKQSTKSPSDFANVELARKEKVTFKDIGMMILIIAPMVTLVYLAAHYAIS